jgi:hypothetical protein
LKNKKKKRGTTISIQLNIKKMNTENKAKVRETRKIIKRILREVRLTFKKNISNLRKEFSDCIIQRFEMDEQKLFEKMKRKKTKTPEAIKRHILKEATEYSIRFHLMEAYDVSYSQMKGCELWNILNECVFFKCDIRDDPPNNNINPSDLLQTMCRFHHTKANLTLLSNPYKRNQSRRSKKTFWTCMEEALLPLNQEIIIKSDDIEECLREWNRNNDLEFFVV